MPVCLRACVCKRFSSNGDGSRRTSSPVFPSRFLLATLSRPIDAHVCATTTVARNCLKHSAAPPPSQDFGLSRHILPADGINAGAVSAVADAAAAAAAAAAATEASPKKRASFAWESDHQLGGVGGDESITGGVGTYLYASPEQMSGKG